MGTYRRILKHLKPYWVSLGVSVLCSLDDSVFSGFSIHPTIPLLETLFYWTAGGCSRGGEGASIRRLSASGIAVFIQGLGVAKTIRLSFFFIICVIVVARSSEERLRAYPVDGDGHMSSTASSATAKRGARACRPFAAAFFSEPEDRVGGLISRVINDVPVIISGISVTFFTSVARSRFTSQSPIARSLSPSAGSYADRVRRAAGLSWWSRAIVGLRVHKKEPARSGTDRHDHVGAGETISGVRWSRCSGWEAFRAESLPLPVRLCSGLGCS